MNIFLRWSKKENPLYVRMIALFLAGLIFPILIPYTLIIPVSRLNALFHLPTFYYGLPNLVVGGVLILCGMFFAFWSIVMQVVEASGTPLPMLPTQKLLVRGPFRYCRNPMSFGTFCAYAGIGVAVGSPAALIVVAIFAGLLILYIKRIEEKELAARFGQAYLDYLKVTPFLIPRWRRK